MPGAAQFEARVDHVERLGDASLVYARVAEAESAWVVKTDRPAPAPGTLITLSLLPQDLHLFDGDGWACERTVELTELM
jgi:ABC-type sugar transport system ATPase subunit